MVGGTFEHLDQIDDGTNRRPLDLPVVSQAIGQVNWNANENGSYLLYST